MGQRQPSTGLQLPHYLEGHETSSGKGTSRKDSCSSSRGSRHGSKENAGQPGQGGDIGRAVLAGVAAVGVSLLGHQLRRVGRTLSQKQVTLPGDAPSPLPPSAPPAEELDRAQGQLQSASSRLSEAMEELESTRGALRASSDDVAAAVAALELRTAELRATQGCLEAALGELGMSRSRVAAIEGELTATRRSLGSTQSALERAKYDLIASRDGHDAWE